MNDERTELQTDVTQSVDDRQPWQRPTLKRLRVNLDTETSGGPIDDGPFSTFSQP